jgi:hypothetical protein
MASTEARSEGAQVAKDLHELRSSARIVVDEQRALVARIEREWQLRIDQTAQRAGEMQAQAFGENISRGLQGKIAELTVEVERVTQSFAWKSSLRWILGIAIAIPLTVAVSLSALSQNALVGKPALERAAIDRPDALPVVIGLTAAQTREAAARLSLCQVPKTNAWHVCIDTDNPPRVGQGEVVWPRVVVRGM